MLTPYMNSVPAVIAKASAIHNPIVYAITHPKYRYGSYATLSLGYKCKFDICECQGGSGSQKY